MARKKKVEPKIRANSRPELAVILNKKYINGNLSMVPGKEYQVTRQLKHELATKGYLDDGKPDIPEDIEKKSNSNTDKS